MRGIRRKRPIHGLEQFGLKLWVVRLQIQRPSSVEPTCLSPSVSTITVPSCASAISSASCPWASPTVNVFTAPTYFDLWWSARANACAWDWHRFNHLPPLVLLLFIPRPCSPARVRSDVANCGSAPIRMAPLPTVNAFEPERVAD